MKSILPFSTEHEAFREKFATFCDAELTPRYQEWQEKREVTRDVYKKLGDLGYLCMWAGKQYGGQEADFLYGVIQIQETSRRGLSGVAIWLHSDVVAPSLNTFGAEELKAKYMPQLVSGEKLICIAMTEPEHGSDLGAIESTAVKDKDGYVLNGHKVYITNGMISDLVVVAAKTDPAAGPRGISLFLVDTDSAGFTREKMKKIGFHAQDTAELRFKNVRVPAGNLLGKENEGYKYLMSKLQTERLVAAQLAQGQGERVLEIAVKYAKERSMYGKKLSDLQHTQFTLADMATQLEAARALVDSAVIAHLRGENIAKEVSMAKYLCTETAFKVASTGLQIQGGSGYCYDDAEMGRLFIDTRVQCMSAGTSEVMKLLIARSLGV
jgi:acyl-CoA dehydrogenase